MSKLIELNKTRKQPIYQQIVESVKGKIRDGVLHSGDQLPSINQVSTEFGLAKETVVKAFRLLQQKGIIKAVHGKAILFQQKILKQNTGYLYFSIH